MFLLRGSAIKAFKIRSERSCMEVGCDRLVAGRRLPKEAQSTRFLQVMWGYFSANISPGRCVFRRIYDERSLAYPANGAQATHVSTQVPLWLCACAGSRSTGTGRGPTLILSTAVPCGVCRVCPPRSCQWSLFTQLVPQKPSHVRIAKTVGVQGMARQREGERGFRGSGLGG